jgi:hypothetical protein
MSGGLTNLAVALASCVLAWTASQGRPPPRKRLIEAPGA